jgi:hypothetical protein
MGRSARHFGEGNHFAVNTDHFLNPEWRITKECVRAGLHGALFFRFR